ncbi:unnamed protein product [Pieris brassicae]|uniref:HTH CENPB-type domain-containing protein n=1 Tax=Pieris brassicae TaxID=7116 RepID=A0A9P0T4M7_PIEBR|nr:unnamed protein product [Pieris brassicae]
MQKDLTSLRNAKGSACRRRRFESLVEHGQGAGTGEFPPRAGFPTRFLLNLGSVRAVGTGSMTVDVEGSRASVIRTPACSVIAVIRPGNGIRGEGMSQCDAVSQLANIMAPRKHSTLTIKDKLRIIEMLDKGGIGRSTVGDIKKNKDKLLKFVSLTECGSGVRKTLKQSENPVLEDALFTWFLQQRRLHVPVSGDMICEKARIFHRQITNSNIGFNASRGWLDKFKKCHRIRRLKMTDEKLSNDEAAIGPFQLELQKVIREKILTAEQVYNADESGLYWRLLPDHTLPSGNEPSASGRKMMKMRVTFMPCANAAGTHKLQLLVVGKSKNPRAFKSTRLPVCYRAQKNAWVTKDLFLEWFKTEFVPAVRRYLLSVNLPPQAMLLLENCPGHPSADELVSEDGHIFAMFLPPNTTACIQPMDQNTSLINKSWKNLHPEVFTDNDEPEDDVPLAQLFNRLTGPNDPQISEAEAQEWAAGGAESELQRYEVLTDEEIVRAAMCKDDQQDEDNSVEILEITKVGNSEAVGALNTALKWAEDNGFDSHEVVSPST